VYVRGRLPAPSDRAVAIIGTREASPYGLRVAEHLAAVCARAGVAVISGLARGIDGAAHRGALEAGGLTVGVVGGGVDVISPPRHAALQARVAETGGLLSEWPDGTPARPFAFPRRNALIAALADVVVVVEAGQRSGTHGTVEVALQLNRTVAAVPGPIDSPQSVGANILLRDGASCIASADDLLALLGAAPRVSADPASDFDEDERAVWTALGRAALDAESVATVTGIGARRATTAIASLELRGVLQVDWAGVYRRAL
jgi:DNA processing protein